MGCTSLPPFEEECLGTRINVSLVLEVWKYFGIITQKYIIIIFIIMGLRYISFMNLGGE